MISKMMSADANDAALVGECLAGNREAFGHIVTRYQSLICSLAYSATGCLSQSEDLAQETFVAAWRQLPALREPEKLRGWLCRIARNLTYDAVRAQGREPSHGGELVEEIAEIKSAAPLPREQTISNEEAAILWRSLEHIPETYREPLVLFYRENQSIEAVAASLELSEDAVKQRLSRGRKLLQEEVLAFVAGALRKTSPGKTFTVGVLAALSLGGASAKAATAGATTTKVGVTAKAGTALFPAPIFLPIAGSLYLTMKASGEDTKSPRERQFAIRSKRILIIALPLLGILLAGVASYFSKHRVLPAGAILPCGFLVFALYFGLYIRARRRQLQKEEGTHAEMTTAQRQEFRANLRRNGSFRHVYLYTGMACNIFGVSLIFRNNPDHRYLFTFCCADTLFACVQAWRSFPKQPVPGSPQKTITMKTLIIFLFAAASVFGVMGFQTKAQTAQTSSIATATITAEPIPAEVTLTRRLENGPYGTSAYSFRQASQDVAIHHNNVDLVFNAPTRLYINPTGGMNSRIVDLGTVASAPPATMPSPGAAWQHDFITPQTGHVYYQEVRDQFQSFAVIFLVTEATPDTVKFRWKPVDPHHQILTLPPGAEAGTMGKEGGDGNHHAGGEGGAGGSGGKGT